MEVHAEIYRYLKGLNPLARWPEMDAILERRAHSRPLHWDLPVKACLACGGRADQALPAAAALASLQTAILLIDDLLDGDDRLAGLGPGQVSNLASAFQSLSLEAALQSGWEKVRLLEWVACLNRTAAETALGQDWDARNPQDEEAYWRAARAKSSPYFRAAFRGGALASGAGQEAIAAVTQAGFLYGEMIQIHDDLNDSLENPPNADWLQMRSPLPLLFAQVVDHPQRERFLELRRAITQPGALEEAQTILVRCGAVSYCFDQLIQRHQAAAALLAIEGLAEPQILAEEFQKLANPVWTLLEKSPALPGIKN